MKICLLSILLFSALFFPAGAQDSTVRYYRDQYGEKETNAAAARFSKTVINSADGKTTTTVKNLRTGKVVSRIAFMGDEPWGYWVGSSEELNYDFPLTYTAVPCTEPLVLENIDDYFMDVLSIGYTAPKLTGEKNINTFLAQNIRYPIKAIQAGLDGKVVLSFRITETGKVEGISVRIGTNIHLDKEAMRVVRKLQFATPPLLNGKPVSVCASLPIKYKLE
jgi:TonB family protein